MPAEGSAPEPPKQPLETEKKDRMAQAEVRFLQRNFNLDERRYSEAKWMLAISIALTIALLAGQRALGGVLPAREQQVLVYFTASAACALAWCAMLRLISSANQIYGTLGGNLWLIAGLLWSMLYFFWFLSRVIPYGAQR